MFEESAKMKEFESAIFTQIDELIAVEKANGKDVIMLNIGNPDLPPAPHVMKVLNESVSNPDNYGYMLGFGVPELLKAIADWYEKNYGVKVDPDSEVLTLLGSQEGLAHIFFSLINPGDVVLVPDPGYPIFEFAPRVAGAEIYRMPLKEENNYLPDLKAIDKEILRKAKAMILNYPNNPLAATAPREFLEEVVEFAKENEILICYDFAYSTLVEEDVESISILSIPGAKDVAIEFNSLSKTFSLPGCRLGYVLGNSKALGMLAKLKSYFDYGIFYPLQKAAIAALTGPQECVKETAQIYQRRRKIVADALKELGFGIKTPKATMYVWASIPGEQSSYDFAVAMLKEASVSVVPGECFGECGKGYIRVALVENEERLVEAMRRVKSWLNK
ncbi:aminotransferase class I/II-fold pyridoxal phosphate-dependent enzyme [Selenomonadales bacterium OttesenSCG-928-I06]|nr:aminotransferase class I/II-fold pyridoxal phosphate-dependent enzyme [Selenomonadales bacterium OttesenSCG-928-I06]